MAERKNAKKVTVKKAVKKNVEKTKIEKPIIEEIKEKIEEKVIEQDPPLENVEKENLGTIIENNPTVELDVEPMNGDPSVLTPKEDEISEMEDEVFKAVFKENKKTRIVQDPLNYSWNGQEIDF